MAPTGGTQWEIREDLLANLWQVRYVLQFNPLSLRECQEKASLYTGPRLPHLLMQLYLALETKRRATSASYWRSYLTAQPNPETLYVLSGTRRRRSLIGCLPSIFGTRQRKSRQTSLGAANAKARCVATLRRDRSPGLTPPRSKRKVDA